MNSSRKVWKRLIDLRIQVNQSGEIAPNLEAGFFAVWESVWHFPKVGLCHEGF